jgi:uncharacterized protein
MSRKSYLTDKAEVCEVAGKGLGLIATARITAGETIAAFGGTVLHQRDFSALSEFRQTHSIQIDDELYLVGDEELEPADFANHSCDPNAGIVGNILLVAMRSVEPGEEICFDYAMSDAVDYDEFVCACGTDLCRKIVTGADWRRPELHERYRGYMSSYIERRIAAECDEPGVTNER